MKLLNPFAVAALLSVVAGGVAAQEAVIESFKNCEGLYESERRCKGRRCSFVWPLAKE